MSWKRSGILLIHAGLIVLMMSELITGLFAVEGNMPIATGATTNYVKRNEHMELAVVRPVNKDAEELTAVPASILRKGGLIQNPDLPFDVRVVRYMPNTKDLVEPPAGVDNPATAGFGLKLLALEQPEGVGVDSDSKFDAPSAYLQLRTKGSDEPPKVYLVSALLRGPQTVKAGGQDYEISLRPHRDYKPYAIHLLDFTHSVYPGTDIPKDFRSRVRVTGPGEERDSDIYMNRRCASRARRFTRPAFSAATRAPSCRWCATPAGSCPTSPANGHSRAGRAFRHEPDRLPSEGAGMNGYGRIVFPIVVGCMALGYLALSTGPADERARPTGCTCTSSASCRSSPRATAASSRSRPTRAPSSCSSAAARSSTTTSGTSTRPSSGCSTC